MDLLVDSFSGYLRGAQQGAVRFGEPGQAMLGPVMAGCIGVRTKLVGTHPRAVNSHAALQC